MNNILLGIKNSLKSKGHLRVHSVVVVLAVAVSLFLLTFPVAYSWWKSILSTGHWVDSNLLAPFISDESKHRVADVPIFGFHLVRPAYTTDTREIKRYLVTKDVFEKEMKYLSDNGYHTITFATLEDYLVNGTPLPKNPVILSFDDGWENQFVDAFPSLQKYHLTATFFVFTNAIGYQNHLTWDQIKTLSDSGMIIGSHTRSHPFLTEIPDPSKLRDEIVGSKKIIESHIGVVVNDFAYPFGFYNQAVIEAVKNSGYKDARIFSRVFTSPFHSLSDSYTLTAIPAPADLGDFERDLVR